MSTLAKFRAIAREFADDAAYTDDVVDVYLELAALEVSSDAWGNYYDEGVVRLAAHLLTMSERELTAGGSGGAAGPVVSLKAGKEEVRYGATAGVLDGDAALKATSHGSRFVHLRSLAVPPAVVI